MDRCAQVVLPRGLEGLLEEVLGGVGLLKFRSCPGLAAGEGTDNSASGAGDGRGFEAPSETDRKCSEACGLIRGVLAGLAPLLSMRRSSIEGSLE